MTFMLSTQHIVNLHTHRSYGFVILLSTAFMCLI